MLGKRFLEHSTLGIIAPASPSEKEVIDRQIECLRGLGFKLKLGKHLYDKYGFLAGTDEERAQDLMDAFLDEKVDAIMCYRGGYGTIRMLPYLDFNIIKNNPKIFIGFSDVTLLLNSIYERCGLTTFHGVMANSGTDNPISIDSLKQSIMKGYDNYSICNPKGTPLTFKNFSGNIEGTLVGGNLAVICSSIGTDYEIDVKDKILFLEDIAEPPYKLDRLLAQLALSGKLKECRGVLLGQFTNCTLPHYERSFTLEQVIEDNFISKGIPICYHIMSGHGSPRLTLPIGAKVRLNAENKCIDVLEAVVK